MKIYDMLLANAMMGEGGGGGGGGSSDLTVTLDTLNVPETTLTGEDDGYGGYEKFIDLNVTPSSDILDGVPYKDGAYYALHSTNGTVFGTALNGIEIDIDGVHVQLGYVEGETGHYHIWAYSDTAFTIVVPSMVMTYYRMSKDVADKLPVNASVTFTNW